MLTARAHAVGVDERAAIIEAATVYGEEASELLTQFLSDPNASLRLKAVEALGRVARIESIS